MPQTERKKRAQPLNATEAVSRITLALERLADDVAVIRQALTSSASGASAMPSVLADVLAGLGFPGRGR